MNRIHLFDDDRVLLLNPRWGDLGAAMQVLLLVLLFAVPLGLVLWLYVYEMRLVPRRTAWVLLSLRTLALLLLLMLVGLQPVYARITHEDVPGRVILAIDVSESMGVADPQREPADKLKHARALKIAGDLCSGSQLDDWIAQYEAGKKTIEFVAADEFRGESEKRKREIVLRRKAHDALIERVDRLTRSQAVKELLSPEGVGLLRRLAAKNRTVEVIGFAADAQDVKLEAVDELFRKDALKKDEKKPDEKKPDDKDEKKSASVRRSGSTDLGLPLARALERSGAGTGKVLGVVMLTDGAHNMVDALHSPTKKVRELKEQDIPFFPVAFGSTKPPMDVSIVALTAPSSVFKEVDAPVRVRLKATGLAAQELEVIVHRPGEEAQPLDKKIIKHDGKDREYFESFQVRMDKEGRQTLQVSVKPRGEDVKEINSANNKQSVIVNVADDTSKVLLVEGEARWEFHYLWQALLRDRSMKVKSVVFVQPRLGKMNEKELEKINNPAPALPPAPKPEEDPLFDYDCIILGDVLPEQLPLADRKRLEKYVADRGGTLVMLAGKRGMPMNYADQRKADAKPPVPTGDTGQDPLIKMLPIVEPKMIAPPDGFPVTLTEEGKQTEFMKLDAESSIDDTLKRWAAMPRHGWGCIGTAKQGATVLAYVAGEAGTQTPEEKRKRELESALMVRHNYGFGRVFYVGVDSTWRYRFRIGDAYHHRFWSQTIRWAASDKPLITGNKFVRFGTPQAVYRHDEPVKMTVRLSDEIEKLPADMLARARILRKGDDDKDVPVALVQLKAKPLQPRVLEAQLRDLPEGEYFIEPVIAEMEDKLLSTPGPDGKAVPLRASFKVASGENGEMVNLATNFALLRELAEKNGSAKVYTPETVEELIEKLTEQSERKTGQNESPLWSWWPLLVAALLLLTVEWVIRKLSGLP